MAGTCNERAGFGVSTYHMTKLAMAKVRLIARFGRQGVNFGNIKVVGVFDIRHPLLQELLMKVIACIYIYKLPCLRAVSIADIWMGRFLLPSSVH